ncbi:M23 family metallopeptidase [Glycomyces xiaoerkulensis]|uniref:M23 family metallopeptidase n=1 Tax=Glycomyces xiaoerkulensis TaxID=2038139 RepID=UPI000C2577F7|nr:M23 family metallopeptidase [Glycomyces xiaoerkulensis]
MKKSRVVLLSIGVLVTGLVAAMVIIPGFGPRTFIDPVISVFGGPTCDDTKCPPDAEWTQPINSPVTSQFRSEERPEHHGVDMSAPRGTQIFAASAGVVIASDCNASLDGESYSCDVDGSPEVGGCGWYVKILHAGDIATLYCHMESRPEVEEGDAVSTGQVLGHVGTSGNSSEPHLHFETQVGNDTLPPHSALAVDPIPFMEERGAPLD